MYDISLNSSYSSGFDLENFIWPVPTEAYDFITPSIINGILMLTNKHANSDDIRAILISKIFDISSDLSRIARVSTDYLYFKKSDKLLEYNAELHPILHFIISYVFFGAGRSATFISIIVTLIVLLPIILRLSRNIWINMFMNYDERLAKK